MSAVAEVAPARAADRRWLGFALAFVALTIWAGWFAVTRPSPTRELGAYDIAALRLGVGAMVLLPAFLRSARGIPRAAWREGAVPSACWGAPFVLLLSWGHRAVFGGARRGGHAQHHAGVRRGDRLGRAAG